MACNVPDEKSGTFLNFSLTQSYVLSTCKFVDCFLGNRGQDFTRSMLRIKWTLLICRFTFFFGPSKFSCYLFSHFFSSISSIFLLLELLFSSLHLSSKPLIFSVMISVLPLWAVSSIWSSRPQVWTSAMIHSFLQLMYYMVHLEDLASTCRKTCLCCN